MIKNYLLAMANPVKSLRTLAFLALVAGSQCWTQQANAQATEKYTPEINQKIREVETHLAGWVQMGEGQGWTLQERMASYHLQAVSIAVINNYKIEWAKAYGWADSAARRPATTATLFQAASISKSLNGVGVLKLVQDGRLDLDADVNNYLKSWKFPYDSLSKGKKISVANLLSHTAGLSVHGFPGYDRGDSIPDISQILDGRRPANSPPVRSLFQPGLRSQYSGGGITLSQLLVQDITGQAYDRYMQENVLDPMSMTSSTYAQPPPDGKAGLVATGYRAGGKELPGKYHIYPEQAAAGLWTNPTDLGRYITETQLSYEGKSAKVLSQATTIRRLTPYIDSSAALGVFINQKGADKYFGHGGANEGFRSQYFGSLQGGRGVVVMVNSDNGNIMAEIINSVATVYQWKDFYKPVVKKNIAIDDKTADSYTGRYLINGDTILIFKKDGRIFIDGGPLKTQIHFTSDREFWVYEDRTDLEFTVTGGRVEGILINHRLTAKKID